MPPYEELSQNRKRILANQVFKEIAELILDDDWTEDRVRETFQLTEIRLTILTERIRLFTRDSKLDELIASLDTARLGRTRVPPPTALSFNINDYLHEAREVLKGDFTGRRITKSDLYLFTLTAKTGCDRFKMHRHDPERFVSARNRSLATILYQALNLPTPLRPQKRA